VNSKLLVKIYQVVEALPPLALDTLTKKLAIARERPFNQTFKAELLNDFPNANFRRVVSEFLEIWQQEVPELGGQAIALALNTAAHASATTRSGLSAELVWTGPDVSTIPVRRTEQVLLQLIQEAQHTLTIISFAVYKVPDIAKALIDAMNRDIRLTIIAETPPTGEVNVPFGVTAGLGAAVAKRAQVFVWDKAKRPRDAEGRHGSLHMKCAIADRQHLFISSANLTEYAMTLNMEMGLLLHSQALAGQVAEHIDQLIHQEILVRT
jgi:phosphatidylserine/phosphatidylglycerophosphate/cardiolipin synthase-like enzyme